MGKSSKKSDVVAVTAAASPVPMTPSAPQVQSTEASKTVIARKVPFSISKSDLMEFFKQAGKVVDAHFATEEAAKKALELDGQNLCNRDIGVDLYGSRTTGASKTLIAKHLSLSITKSDL
ncbi:hypothetical protein MKX01_016185 [Papaver californicum]|nr:hypothetical protein MKX01_016185 [Papaver californicum]